MNSLLDRLSIGAAVLIACAALADVGAVARIVPMADGLSIVINVDFGAGTPAFLARFLAGSPAAECPGRRLGSAT